MSRDRSPVRENLTTVRELMTFIWHGRTWWLSPIVIIMLLLSFLVAFLETSAVAPFIYALF